MKAPANRSPTETGSGAMLPSRSWAVWFTPCSMSATKISTVEGGMICARVAEAPMTPVASLGS